MTVWSRPIFSLLQKNLSDERVGHNDDAIENTIDAIYSALVKATLFWLYAKLSYDQGKAFLSKAFVDTINDAISAIKNMIG